MRWRIKFIENGKENWGWWKRQILDPLFPLPKRPGIRDRIEQAVKSSGYSVGDPQNWYEDENSDLMQCFEIAEFIVGRSSWMRDSLRRWEEANHVCMALGLVFIIGALFNFVSLYVWITHGDVVRIFFAPILASALIYLASKCFRLSSYFEIRGADQLLTWFILTATGPKRGANPRSERKAKTTDQQTP